MVTSPAVPIPDGGTTVAWRSGVARWLVPLAESLAAVAIALAMSGAVLAVTGHDPLVAGRELVSRTLLRPIGIQEVLVRAIPLLLAGLAVLLAARAGLWNIGIDGQVLAGALAAAVAATWLDGAGRPVLWLAAFAAAVVAGAVWAAPPAILRAHWGVNEIVTTIMLNYVALSLTAWLVKGPLKDDSLVAPQTPLIPRELRLATFGDTRVHAGLVLALLLWALLVAWLHRSVPGFELRVSGENPRAARHAMIPVSRVLVAALVASGAIAALAGANDVLSTKGTFQGEWNPAYGLSAFALVFLARRQVLALVPAALFLGMLSYGGDVLPRAADIPAAFFTFFEGVLLAVLAVFRWRAWWRARGGS